MKRIAALALVAALGATAASAEEIKPVTSTQNTFVLFGNTFSATTAAIVGGAVVAGAIVIVNNNDNSGTAS